LQLKNEDKKQTVARVSEGKNSASYGGYGGYLIILSLTDDAANMHRHIVSRMTTTMMMILSNVVPALLLLFLSPESRTHLHGVSKSRPSLMFFKEQQPSSSNVAVLVTFLIITLAPWAANAVEEAFSSNKLGQSRVFQALPTEYSRNIPLKSNKRVLQDLQDSRLDLCADRGTYWENCFMFGVGGVDSAEISNSKTQTTKLTKNSRPPSQRPPTW